MPSLILMSSVRKTGNRVTNFSAQRHAWGTAASRFELESVLEDAESVVAAEAPGTLVTMNTTVELEDPDSESRRSLTVVYPQNADDGPNTTSVVEPLGLAILGRRVGDVLQCPGELGHGLRIKEIVYQPERAGEYYL
jgi:regulator of nucleoside diphosphate kinase